jgi:hypothetical protein
MRKKKLAFTEDTFDINRGSWTESEILRYYAWKKNKLTWNRKVIESHPREVGIDVLPLSPP